MPSVSFKCPLSQPFDLFGTHRFSRLGKADPTFDLSPNRLERAFWFKGQPVHLKAIVINGEIEVSAEGISAETLAEYVPIWLGYEAENFSVEGHPLLQQLSHRHAGLRKVVTPNLGYDLIQTVMQQLIEWREAANAWRRLVRALGSSVGKNHDLMLPPSYETIATMDLGIFQDIGISMKRGAVIRELGRLGHRIDTWQEGSLTELRQKLLSIPGIGPWTVEHCLGFSLAAPDAVPLGDYQLPHTVCWALANEPRGDDQRMVDLLKPWQGQRWSVLRLIFASNLRAPRRGPRIAMGNPQRPRLTRRMSG